MFGEDLSDRTLILNVGGKDQRLLLKTALGLVSKGIYQRFGDPIRLFFDFFLDKTLTKRERTHLRDMRSLRQVVRDYVEDRKAGKNKSKLSHGKDLLDIMLEDKEMFAKNTELVID